MKVKAKVIWHLGEVDSNIFAMLPEEIIIYIWQAAGDKQSVFDFLIRQMMLQKLSSIGIFMDSLPKGELT